MTTKNAEKYMCRKKQILVLKVELFVADMDFVVGGIDLNISDVDDDS